MPIARFWWCVRKKRLLKTRLELEQQYLYCPVNL
jgi:hypothetical protein